MRLCAWIAPRVLLERVQRVASRGNERKREQVKRQQTPHPPNRERLEPFPQGLSTRILYTFEWTLVRPDVAADEFVIGDNPVSLYDPRPLFPGGGVGLMSSPLTETFLPLAPRLALLLRPTRNAWTWFRERGECFQDLKADERWDEVIDLEGPWAEGVPTETFALDLNLRSYAQADRFVFGSQKALQDLRSARHTHAARLSEVARRGPRSHFVEGDTETGFEIKQTFAPKRRRTASRG